MQISTRLLLMLFMVAATVPATADTMRCNGRLVSTGDRMYLVRERCGEPDVKVIQSAVYAGHRGYIPDREQWQYNLGPNRRMRFVDFVDGELRRVRTGPRGFSRVPDRCDPALLSRGISKLELLGRCGKPDHVEERTTDRRFRAPPGGHYYREGVPAEDWIYRIGDGRYPRIVTLIDGWVVRVERGEARD